MKFLLHEHVKECGQGRKQFYSKSSAVTSMRLKLKVPLQLGAHGLAWD